MATKMSSKNYLMKKKISFLYSGWSISTYSAIKKNLGGDRKFDKKSTEKGTTGIEGKRKICINFSRFPANIFF